MNNLIMKFPAEVRNDIATIFDGGTLSAECCHRICKTLSIDIKNLMIQLLPLAASYSKPIISSFQVGAVVLASKGDAHQSELYIGANIEYESLTFSVHAEQAAISNAWLNNNHVVDAIAVTAAPCGHCRQFLHEIAGTNALQLLVPSEGAAEIFTQTDNGYAYADLEQLLPAAFGPIDLDWEEHWMDSSFTGNPISLENPSEDKLIIKALDAAKLSYAPYSLNYAGCAVKLTNGNIFSGRYAENAAHNPSLSPFSAAISQAMLSDLEFDYANIERIVLVEQATSVSQIEVTKILLASCTTSTELEYYPALQN